MITPSPADLAGRYRITNGSRFRLKDISPSDPWGKRFTGKAAVREGLATRFKGLPDVHYSDDRHWVSGNMGVSEWLLTGTSPDGRAVRVRGERSPSHPPTARRRSAAVRSHPTQ